MAFFLGAVALSIQALVLARPHNNGLLGTLAFCMLLWATHYWLLGSPAAAALHVLAAGTMVGAAMGQGRSWCTHALLPASIVANLGFGVWLAETWPDYVMTAGNILFAVSHTCLKGKSMRAGYIVAESVIGLGAGGLGSAPGVAVCGLMVIANALALARWQLQPGQCYQGKEMPKPVERSAVRNR